MRVSSNNIQSLLPNQVFVFGSNRSGFHSAGAALTSKNKFGAIEGQGEGLQGSSYGIPTKDFYLRRILSVNEIGIHVNSFIDFVMSNPKLDFLVTEIGCGFSNYHPKDIAPLFKECLTLPNVYLPQSFINYLI